MLDHMAESHAPVANQHIEAAHSETQTFAPTAETPAAKEAEKETESAAKSVAREASTDIETPTIERALIPETFAPTNLSAHEIIFIDAAVSGLQQYILDHPQADVVLLDATKDGMDQIAAVLAGRSDITAIHILSHGSAGQLFLGNSTLDLAGISGKYAADLAVIKAALSDNADILVYGCNVAAGEQGLAFEKALATATGADIAASTDITGAAAKGGNWGLESKIGVIDARSIAATGFDGTLAAAVISITPDSLTVKNAAGTVVTTGATGYSGASSAAVGQGGSATWVNAGTIGGKAIDLRATIITLGAGDTLTFNRPVAGTNDPGFVVNDATGDGASALVRWETFLTGTNTAIAGDVNFTVADLDGIGGAANTREQLKVSTDTLTSYTLATTTDVAVSTATPGIINVSGTQNETAAPPTAISAIKFNWTNTSSFDITYSILPNAVTRGAGFSHDGNNEFAITGAAVSIPRLDLDGDNSTGTTSNTGYQSTFTENGAAKPIVDTDVTITNPVGNVTTAVITLTNAQALDALNIGSLAGLGITATTDTSVAGVIKITLSGSTTAANYQSALQAITFSNASESPVTTDRSIDIYFGNGTFTSNVATSIIHVLSVNDAPAGTDKTVTINEDTNYVVTAADFGFSDPVDTTPNTFAGILVTSLPPATEGVYKLNGVAVALNQVITIADINAGKLIFTPVANLNGAAIGALGFKVQDNGGILNGGVDTDPTANTLKFDITAVNDAPTISAPAALTTTEDTVLAITGFTIADVDSSTSSVSVTFDIPAGSGTLSWATSIGIGIDISSTATHLVLNGQITAIKNAINAGKLTYIPTPDFNTGASTFTLTSTVNDKGNTGSGPATGLSASTTTQITVTPVVDIVADVYTIAEDNTLTFNPLTGVNSGVGATGSGADNFEGTTPQITAVNGAAIAIGGSVTFAGKGTLTLGANNTFTFVPVANFTGAVPQFTYTVLSGGVTETSTIDITVTPVNDAPAGTDKTITINEDATYVVTLADFGFSDPNDTPANTFDSVIVTSLPASGGTYSLNGAAVTLNQTILATDIAAGKLTFIATPNFSGTAIGALGFKVKDNGGVVNGGVDTDPTANTLNFNITSVNDAPSGTDKTIAINEDVLGYTVTVADFGFSDPNDTPANAFANVIVSSIPPASEGVYKLNGVAITANQVITVADITAGKLVFTPAANKNGAALGALGFKVQDNGGTVNGGIDTDQTPNILQFNIAAVNDAPTLTVTGPLTTPEDTPLALTGITFADVDSPAGTAIVSITIVVSGGTLNLASATGVTPPATNGTGSVILSGSITDIQNAIAAGKLSYSPVADFNNSLGGLITLTATINDNGNTGTGGALSATASTTIAVTSVADIVADSYIGTQNTNLVFNPVSGSTSGGTGGSADNFEGTTPQITAVNGVAIAPGGSVTFAGKGTLTLGTGANSNQFTFAPVTNSNGAVPQFTYTVTSGGVRETSTIDINFTAVNLAPTATPTTVTTLEDTPATLNLTGTDIDGTIASVSIPTLPLATQGVLYLADGVTPVAAGQVLTPAEAATLKFIPAPNFNGTVIIPFNVKDNQGLVSASPANATISITPVDDVVTIGGTNNGTVAGTDAQVKESDLATGTSPAGTGETATGTFTLGPAASLTSLTINGGAAITLAQLTVSGTTPIVRTGSNGTLTISGYNATTGVVTYSYLLTSAADHTGNVIKNDTFAIVTTDVEGDTVNGSLAINILDDAPIAKADVDEVYDNPLSSSASGNVFTGVGGTDFNNADGIADIIGADGSANALTPVTGVVAGTGTPIAGNLGVGIAGAHGTLTLNADGSYTYVPFGTAGLLPGQTITDVFTYGIADGDGDAATTTLTITVTGVPAIIGLGDGAVAGTDGSVLESDLNPNGTNAAGLGETINGSFQLVTTTNVTTDLASFTIDPAGPTAPTTLTLAQLNALSGSPLVITTANGTLTLTNFDSATGQLSYQYTLTTPPNSAVAVTDDFKVSLIDNGGANTSSANTFLKIAIIDDAPIATNDSNSINENTLSVTTTALTGVMANDKIGADGPTGTNNPVTGVIAGAGVPGNVGVGSAVTGNFGSVIINADGSYTYNLNNANPTVNALQIGQSLTDTFTYKITDKDGDTATATLTITINGQNDAPVAVVDTDTTLEDTPAAGNVLVNDTDPDAGDTKTVTQFTVPGVTGPLVGGAFAAGSTATIAGVGTLVINADGSYVFTPVLNYSGAVPVATYTMKDSQNATASSTLTITITPVNDAPVANPDTNSTPEDTPLVVNAATGLLANDTDPDTGDTKTITSFAIVGVAGTFTAGSTATIAGIGTLKINADGSYTFTPALNFNGAVPVATYTMRDTAGLTASSTLTLNVTPVNDAPVAVNDAKTTLEDTPASGNVLLNDSDVDSPTLTVTQFVINGTTVPVSLGTPGSITIAGKGTITIASNGDYTFTPVLNFNDSLGPLPTITYTVNDGSGAANNTAAATLTISVTPVNDPPVATPATITPTEDTPIGVPLVGTDIDGTIASVTITAGPTAAQGRLTYDDDGNPATPPVAVPLGTALTPTQANSVNFEPAANYNGPVAPVTFFVTDNNGAPSAPANVTINNVTAVNDAPVALPDTNTTLEDTPVSGNVLLNDSDVDGPNLKVASYTVTGAVGTPTIGVDFVIPNVGKINIAADGSYTFTPAQDFNGTVPTITYTVTDNNAPIAATATTTLSITVTPVNDAPVAVDDNLSTNEDTPVTLDLVGNDTDVDGDTLSVKSINGTTLTPGTAQVIAVPNGVVNVNAAGVITFTPNANYNGPVSFNYVVQDGHGGEDTGTVSINVVSVNDAPVTVPEVATTPEDTPISGNILTNDSDVDVGDTLSVTQFTVDVDGNGTIGLGETFTVPPGGSVTTPTIVVDGKNAGTITIASDGSYTFTPAQDFNGTIPIITYTVNDGSGAVNNTATATLSISVTPVNDPPVATTPPALNVNEDTGPFALSLTGTDVDGTVDKITVTGLPPASQGVLTYQVNGAGPFVSVPANTQLSPTEAATIRFEPVPDFNGTVTVAFNVTDNLGAVSPSANAIINIASVNDAPVAIGGNVSTDKNVPIGISLTGTDVDGTVATMTISSIPSGTLTLADGVTAVTAGSTITAAQAAGLIYTPALNFSGNVIIGFRVTDNDGLASTSANYAIGVQFVNDAPQATPLTTTGSEDTPLTVVLPLGIDVDIGTPANDSIVSYTINSPLPPATQGVLYYPDGVTPIVAGTAITPAQAAALVFKPAANFNGSVAPFTYRVTDSFGALSNNATINITIGAVNDAPVALPDTKTIDEDAVATGNVLTNDSDVDSPTLTVTKFVVNGTTVNVPAGGTGTITIAAGTIAIGSNGAYTFTPTLNFNGTVPTITYTVNDGSGAANATVTSTLDITVNPVNDPPVATPVTATGNEGTPIPIALTGTDVEGPVTITVPTLPDPTQGTLYLADGTTKVIAGQVLTPAQAAGLIFIPYPQFNGTVTVPFTVTDNQGVVSPSANAVINVTFVNDLPIASPVIKSVPEDTPVPISLTGTDIDGTIASVTVTSLPLVTQGILYLADGTTPVSAGQVLTPAQAAGLIFKPAPNFNGTVNIPFTVTDNNGGVSTPANAQITLTPVNDPPVAINASVNGLEDTPTTVNLAGTDVDGTIAKVIVTNLPPAAQGILYLPDGVTAVAAGTQLDPAVAASLIFKPALNFNGVVTIPFSVIDNNGAPSAPANFVIDVGAVDDDPIATPTVANGPINKPLPISLTGTDVEGPIAAVTIVTLPPVSQGILTKADGTPVVAGVPLTPAEAAMLIFKPAPNFFGTLNITFTVTDSAGQISSPPANLQINIANPTIGADILFEQLQSQPIKPFSTEFDPNNLNIRTPVIPLGMPEDLFVSNSVRESANQIAANSSFGVFNADSPTLNEINNFTFDLKGLPIGMDSHLYVQHAVRSEPVTTEPNLFVQNSVRQSQIESTTRNIGITSFNTASNAVSSLLSPFDLGAPGGVQAPNTKTAQAEEKTNENQRDIQHTKLALLSNEVEVLFTKEAAHEKTQVATKRDGPAATPRQAAPSFANQLKIAANKYKHNTFKEKF